MLSEAGFNSSNFRVWDYTHFDHFNSSMIGMIFVNFDVSSAAFIVLATYEDPDIAMKTQREMTRFLKTHAEFLPDGNGTYVYDIVGDTSISMDTDSILQWVRQSLLTIM